MKFCIAFLVLQQVFSFGSNAPEEQQPRNLTLPFAGRNAITKIAFIGDQGLTAASKKVLELIKRWNADITVHAGDFDYANYPEAFMKQHQNILGHDYPYIAAIGNHDLFAWNEYKYQLQEQLHRSRKSRNCHGEYGVKMTCVFNNVLIVMSGIGTRGTKHAAYLDQALTANANVPFRVCVWHKNQHMYQLGTKADETGYEVYDVCRRHGAIVATAHEHSYSRTHLMADYAQVKVASTSFDFDLMPGRSFAFVSGLGGRSIRPYRHSVPLEKHWAAYAAKQNGAQHGALLCEFNSNKRGSCWFEDIDGKVWDEFSFNLKSAPVLQSFRPFLGRDIDTQVSNPQDVVLVTNDGTSYCNPYVVDLSPSAAQLKFQLVGGDEPQRFVFQFNNFSLNGNITHAYLQFYSTHEGVGNMDVEIHHYRGKVACQDEPFTFLPGSMSEQSVLWQDDGLGDRDGWESNEVWSSPDVKSLMSSHSNSTSISFVLVLKTAGGKHFVSGFGKDGKYAPSLFVQFE